jgi:hypothetical protein
MRTFIKKKRSQINNLMMHLKLLEKQEHGKPKSSRGKEIIKIRKKWRQRTVQRNNDLKKN